MRIIAPIRYTVNIYRINTYYNRPKLNEIRYFDDNIKLAIDYARNYCAENQINCYILSDQNNDFMIDCSFNKTTKLVEVLTIKDNLFMINSKLSEQADKPIINTIKQWFFKNDLTYDDKLFHIEENYDNVEWITINYASGSDYSGDDITYSNYLYIKDNFDCSSFENGYHSEYGIQFNLEQLITQNYQVVEMFKRLDDYPILDENGNSDLRVAWESQAFDDSYKYDINKCLENYLENFEETEENDLDLPHNLNKAMILEYLNSLDKSELASYIFYEMLSNEKYYSESYFETGIANLVIRFNAGYEDQSITDEIIDQKIIDYGKEYWELCHKDQLLLPFDDTILTANNMIGKELYINMKICLKLGFCAEKSLEFCTLNNLDPNDAYTVLQLKQACKNTPQFKRYIDRLEKLSSRRLTRLNLAS